MLELLPDSIFAVKGRRYRFLGAYDSPAANVVVIELGRQAVPQRWFLAKANPAKDESFQVLDDYQPFQRPHTESDEDIERGKAAYACIKGLIARKNIFDGKQRAPMLRQHCADLAERKIAVDPKTLLRWLIKYWQGGSDIAALYTNFFRSGYIDENTKDVLSFEQSTRDGKRAIHLTPEGRGTRGRNPRRGTKYQWKPGERRKVLERAWTHFSADQSKSIHGAYISVLAELFSERDELGIPRFTPRGKAVLRTDIPSRHQMEYACSKVFSASRSFRMRHGKHEFDNNVNPRNGSVLQDTRGPGDVYEVDATKMDIFLVDRKTRRTVIGKPTLYLVIDRWSRLITGFHISLENPSWSEAKLAIANLCTDWREIGKELGVKVLDSDVVALGRWPNRFFADRSEFITEASEALGVGLSTPVTNAKAKMPADKPIVESGIKSLQAKLRQFAPGYEPPETHGKRRGKEYYRDARWDINQCRAAVLQIILFHNRTWKSGYEPSEAEIWFGWSLAPIEIWKRGIKARMGMGKRINRDLVLAACCPRAQALVTHHGIHWAHCWYEIPDHKEWQVIAKLEKSIPVNITYTTSLVNSIVVHDPNDKRKSYPATLKVASQKWAGYSKAERHAAWRKECDNAKGGERDRIEYEVALYHHLNEINEAAEKATALAIKNMKHGTRKTLGKKARVDEQRGEREAAHDVAAYFEGRERHLSGAETPVEAAAQGRSPDVDDELLAVPEEDPDGGGIPTTEPAASPAEANVYAAGEIVDEHDDDPYFRPQRGT